ncbi:nucleoside hydrolase [Radiobacillus kanasensis]|uniref:nucleoside hydrolase n=1 Tax=Radiobacillus kanasensis TaxID=2844358 RepID=UPI001E32A8A2|nr:nucleoside hydrolase [Radiobacillus kanasensis]UFT98702.1 nucleoside hydrolase [Radiobacillus kanasensis]
MQRIPTIIDCDPGIDDIMALLFAFASEELSILLITTSAGNQTQDKTVSNALNFLDYIGKDVEVARGLDQPFYKELQIADHVHGESGIGDVTFPTSKRVESKRFAIEAMVDVLSKAAEPITIIATGPLTNIGALLLSYPHLKSKIKQISIMGGAAKGGNVTPTAEFNLFVDPDAADIVFRSGIPVVMSGLDVTHKAYLSQDDVSSIEALQTDLSEKIVSMIRFYQDGGEKTPFHEENFNDVIRLHDLCAVAYVVDPTLFQGEEYFVTVERHGTHTNGATVVDYDRRSGQTPNVKVLYEVDRERLVSLFLRAVTICS